MADSNTGAGHSQDEPECLVEPETKDALKENKKES